MSAPAGWYADPEHPAFSRWWNGEQWTNHRQGIEHDTGPLTIVAPPSPEPGELDSAHDLRRRLPAHAVLSKLAALEQRGEFVTRERRRSVVTAKAAPLYRVAQGERAVARELFALDGEFVVVHSVPIGRHDNVVDHVLVGAPGIVVVSTHVLTHQEARVSGSSMLVDGARVHFITHAAHEARRVSSLVTKAAATPVPVTAVVALVDAYRLTISVEPLFTDVRVGVIRSGDLVEYVRSLPPALSRDDASAIARVVADANTWRASPRSEAGATEMAARLSERGRGANRIVDPGAPRRRLRGWRNDSRA